MCENDRIAPSNGPHTRVNSCEVTQMKQNVHNIERVIRIIIGLGLISLVFVGPQTPWGWLGVIPLATGIIGWCPPYALLGINTCKTK
jgi:hypothetical protein